MTNLVTYDPSAALAIIPDNRFAGLAGALEAARNEVLADVELFKSGESVPNDKQPLDAGFVSWPEDLLHDMNQNGADSLIARIERCAERLRQTSDSVVILGIGGSYMGMRAMFEALCDPFHNQLSRQDRRGTPRIYFEGWNVDSDHQTALLRLLDQRAAQVSAENPEGRSSVIVISKSGGTLETAIAFRHFRSLLERRFPEAVQDLIVPITGNTGRLRDLSTAAGFRDVFSIPDGIGGRFSVLTPVGLLPAAVAGINIRQLLLGAASMTKHFRTGEYGQNAVLDFTAVAHLMETDHDMTTRVLSTWGSHMEAVGLWYDQLLSESLGKREKGATPITGVNTRDLHSRGQQHQQGRRDKLITNLLPGRPRHNDLEIPFRDDDFDQLNQFAGVKVSSVLNAAIGGTNQAYADDRRPTADLQLDGVDDHSIGQLFQLLMLSTVVEGRLIGVNPYGQPGVEAYKQNMNAILKNPG
ncbi:MAG: glucose-6-phosphate isomerase [Fuerstiella sp.]|nr:glucose-6-phosphate isomerase [Fuerstiella sp.]